MPEDEKNPIIGTVKPAGQISVLDQYGPAALPVPAAPKPQWDMLTPDRRGELRWTNIDPGGERGLELMLIARSRADMRKEDVIGRTFLARWAYCHIVVLAAKTGDVVEQIRTVLIAPDGGSVSFCSNGIVGGLDAIIECRGPGPWDPPIPLTVSIDQTRMGYSVATLRLAPAGPAPQKKGGRP